MLSEFSFHYGRVGKGQCLERGGTVLQEQESLPGTLQWSQLKAWLLVDTQMLAELRKDWKDREILLLELSLKRWAIEMGMLCPEALAVRVWLPNSEFVETYGWLWALWSW